MSSHLEVSKPSGRELIPLSGQRVTLGKASTNDGVARPRPNRLPPARHHGKPWVRLVDTGFG